MSIGPSMKATSTPAWLFDFFDQHFADLVLDREAAEARSEVDSIVSLLGLESGARVLDQCCGIGTLAIPLARRGFDVVGVDLIRGYVERARERATQARVRVDFHEANALTFRMRAPCDAAFCWRTSFGFHRDDRENQKQIQAAFESLRSGGRYALELGNLAQVVRNFQPCMMKRFDTEQGEVLMLRESDLDLVEGVLHQVWTYVLPNGPRHVREGVTKLYLPHQIAEMMRAVGFVDVELMGDANHPERGMWLDAPRCIVIGAKP
ncbi:MAG: methyltransferase domain-containing protein [Polyangiaceae bacterium]